MKRSAPSVHPPDRHLTARIAQLRESRKRYRLVFSFFGMVSAWLLAVVAMVAFTMAHSQDASGRPDMQTLAVIPQEAGAAAMVGIVAWLLIGLPFYRFWPRRDPYWRSWVVALVGAVGGAVVGVIFALRLPGFQWLYVSIFIGIPAVVGMTAAVTARWLEEITLRRLALEELAGKAGRKG